MAGNHLLLPYKIIDALSSGNLTEIESWQFIKAMVDYDRLGISPDFPRGEASALWAIIQPEIKYNKENWEAEMERRSNAGRRGGKARSEAKTAAARKNGKLGGAPSRNRNTINKDKPETETQPNETQAVFGLNEETQPNETQAEYVNVYEYVNGCNETTTIEIFIKSCKTAGFVIDSKKASDLLATGNIPIDWISGLFNFPELVAERVMDLYPDKSYGEKKNLFLSAFKWEDIQDEFPEWRESKKAEAATREERRLKDTVEQERRQKLEALRDTGPQKCGNCGETILAPNCNYGTCSSCGFEFFLDEARAEWEFKKPSSLSNDYKLLMQSRHQSEIENMTRLRA